MKDIVNYQYFFEMRLGFNKRIHIAENTIWDIYLIICLKMVFLYKL